MPPIDQMPPRGRREAPLRDELLSAERLADEARGIAATQRWVTDTRIKTTPLIALNENAAAALEADNRELARAARAGAPPSPAGEWLLDNYYLVEEQVLLVREDLPPHYGIELPRVTAGRLAGFPRIYEALLSLVSHTDSRLDAAVLHSFITGYQDVSALTIGEVWATPIMLRIALVENLNRLSGAVVASMRAEREADSWAERLVLAAQDDDPQPLADVVSELDAATQTAEAPFYVRLAQRLADLEAGAEPVNRWLEQRLVSRGIRLEAEAAEHQHLQAADQISIANAITSIRFLDAYEWREFFEAVSLVEHELRRDPSGTYAVMDFESRDRYRHALELMAKHCEKSELGVTGEALALCRESLATDPTDAVRGHVGHWLIGGGRYELERRVGYRPRLRERIYRGPLRNKGFYYWGTGAALLAVQVAGLAAYATYRGAGPTRTALLCLLALIPATEVAVAFVNRMSSAVFPPRVLPKLDHRQPLAEAHRTFVVVPALLSSVGATRSVIENLEITYLANRDENLAFGLLGDLKGASDKHADGDERIIEAAAQGITELNDRYEVEHGIRPFHLLVRERRFNETEGTWMGWERKRGALVELAAELRGEPGTSFTTRLGDSAMRRSATFIITLDADTVLPRDGARKLVSTIAHPLNRARIEPGDARVKSGYGLMQPRVGMTLTGSRRSRFAGLYSGPTGIDPYAQAVSDTYQDVFCEGSFTGKGIFEVDVFRAILDGRFPENALLSHDLIEGSFLRTALASDIEVLDDYPANYLAAASRLHRWVRGDWQTLPYLFGRIPDATGRMTPNPLSGLQRYKIFDNLRRSMAAPSIVLLLTLGWLALPDTAPEWPLLVALLVLFPVYFSLADSLLFRPRSVSFVSIAPSIARDFRLDTQRAALSLATLPHQAWLMLDAAGRAVWRRFVTGRKLLEWETAADAEKRAGTTRNAFWRAMGPAAVAAVALLAAGVWLPRLTAGGTELAFGDGSWARALVAAVIAAVWLAGPLAAHFVSVPLPGREPVELANGQRLALRRLSRKTWRFFDAFVTPEGHYLAPDNFQEDPGGEVAWRTSPTNIGLQLLGNLGAYDLGYLTIAGMNDRISETLHSMAGLERYHGHFYNWYDVRTLEPLRPAYVSTVDSGNLAGHLLVLRIGLLEASEAPVLGPQLIDGAADAVRLAIEDLVGCSEHIGPVERVRALHDALESIERSLALSEPPDDLGEWAALLERLCVMADEAVDLLDGITDPADAGPESGAITDRAGSGVVVPIGGLPALHASVADAARALRGPSELLAELAPWAGLLGEAPHSVREREALRPLLDFVPSLVGLAEGLAEALAELDALADGRGEESQWAASVAAGIREGRPACVELLARVRLCADIAREMWEHTDFTMLYDDNRGLFSIGYNLSEGRLDASYYDLIASECRLASFLAVAKGDVPQEHWFRLGRSLTKTRDGRALVSWSASMFEYLMPLLVMRDWPGTLLSETYSTVVARQMGYGAERGVPWGVSESAFNAKDANLVYQYQAFGVPGLGLKRGLSDDVVVAPYASILALPVDAQAVLSNLDKFTVEGAEGRYGYYESLDYTPGRVPAGHTRAVVRSYFAHHQGMAFLALVNALAAESMVERFHADPMVASAELLLQERVPRHVQLVSPHVEEVAEVRSVRELPPVVARTYPTAETPVPSTHFLSNGSYSVMVTNGGGGYSRWQGTSVTRYREDVTRDVWGTFFFLRDVDSGEVFSAPHNPWPIEPDEYRVTFAPDKAIFFRVDGELATEIEVVVSPEDDVEVRRISLSNRGMRARRLEVTSYFEIALVPQAADQAHKSFSNLFVETEAVPENNAVLFTRRPRSSTEKRIWGLHLVACEAMPCSWSYETDRAAFLGRLRGVDRPAKVEAGGELGGSQGAVLDPCCAMRRSVEVGPGETVRLAFATGVARSREEAIRLTEKYHDVRSAQRAIDLAWTSAQLELRDLGITPAEAVTLERLASRLLLTNPYSPLKLKTPAENGLPVSGLWSIGVSGDWPILLVRVEELDHAPLVRQALLAHQYWRHKGLVGDLVILNTRPTGYSDELDDRLRLLVRTGHALQLLDKPGGVFLRRSDQMHPDVITLLESVARAVLDGDSGSLELQLNRRAKMPGHPPAFTAAREPKALPTAEFTRPELRFDNGLGGFDPATREYVIVLEGDDATPAPWINVMANREFGCMVTEAGVGCTWALNSHENRITTWNNDPVTDGSGEAFYIRDEQTGEFWSPTPLPVRASEPYVVRHGRGSTRFEHTSHGIAHELDWFVAADEPVRVCHLRLTNLGDETRRLSVTHLVEWVLGDSRSKAQHLVVTWFDAENEMLTAHNHYNMDFPGRCAFVACDRPLASWTASRSEFVGRNRGTSDPAAMHRTHLGEVSGRFHDNCGALQVVVEVAPGSSETVTFLLGQTATLEEARELVANHRAPGAAADALSRACGFWDGLLGTVVARTPDERLDLLVNGPVLYQAVACRLWGRTATYQSSGAFGFRDQLQDVMALLYVRPDLVREQIIEASRHQFPEGDVLHWWQPFSGRGVRTHFSDDRHWMPLVVAEYLEATGDASVLAERTAFIEGPELPIESEDAYLQPAISETAATVYEHCWRALERAPLGTRGLPLIGGGDWNDGMNRVGHEGRGESVWMAWFLGYVLTRFAPVCERMGEPERAERYRTRAAELARAVEETSWDGAWYRRAYFDDGTPLGTRNADECRIDAIAQAWATISGLGDPERAEEALESVDEKLVRREDGLIALLAPPFDRMVHDPGYIKGYVPGVRENGGQYTHAALWVALAYLMRGDGDEAAALLDLINPVSHALDRESAERYKVEPYVVAADVYAVAPHTGRGGWTWYTGSASWFYRVAVNWLLGLKVREAEGGSAEPGSLELVVDPCIPKRWPGFELEYRHGATRYSIAVENPRAVNGGVARVELDGAELPGTAVPLVDDGREHAVRVVLLGG